VKELLHNNKNSLVELVEFINDKVIIVNNKDLIVYANKNFEDSFEIFKTEIIGSNYKAIFNHDYTYRKFFISEDNEKIYANEVNFSSKFLDYKLLIFRKNNECLSEDTLVDSSIIFNSIPDILSVHDAHNNVLFYNEAGYNFLNLTEEDVIGKKCFNLIGQNNECKNCPAASSIKLGKIIQRIRHFPDLHKWFDIRAYPIKDKSGSVIQVIEHLRDITQQKEIESQLHESEIKLSLLMENIPGIVYRCKLDSDWTMLFMSEETQRLTGYSPNEFINNRKIPYAQIIHPNDADFVRKTVINSIKKEKNFVVEYRIITKKGEIKHVWEKGKVVRNDNLEFIDGVILDITDRKKTEINLQISEEKYRLLIENQNELIFKIDKHGRFIYVNDTYCDFFGKRDSELINKNFIPMVHEDDMKANNLAMSNLKRHPYTCYIEQRSMSVNGWRWLAWSEKAILDSNNEIKEIIGVGRDITEKKLMEFELIKAKENAEKNDHLKSTLLNNISLKLKTPIEDLKKLNKQLVFDQANEDTLKKINNTCYGLSEFVDNLIILSVIESGRLKIDSETFDLNNLLAEIYNNVNNKYADSNVNLYLHQEINEPLIIFSDKTKIKQIILYLLSNAFNYTKSGEIEFEYIIKNDFIEFTIVANGCGISSDLIEETLDWTSFIDNKGGYNTSGLSLLIAKAYVDLLDGTMKIDSKTEDDTCIKVYIPVKNNAHKKPEPQRDKIPDLSSLVILVAEDERINFQLLKTILTKSGAKVIRANTGSEAIDLVQNNKDISLILMDIKMPGITGNEALREIRKINNELKVIACTAYTQSDESDSFSKQEFDGFLPKPIKRQELFSIINNILKK